MTARTNSTAKTRTTAKSSVDTRAEVATGAMVSIKIAGAVIGLWSLASLVGGMISAGGPVALVKAWFSAVTGM